MVFFEGNRIASGASLAAMAESRRNVARWWSRADKDVWKRFRHALSAEARQRAAEGVRGEVTVVVAGIAGGRQCWPGLSYLIGSQNSSPPVWTRRLRSHQVAREVGLPKREVYDAVLAGSRTP